MDTINVKVGRTGGRVCEYNLPEDSTVDDLLSAHSEALKKGETLSIDGETVESDYELGDGDEVIIFPSTTGA